MAIVTDVRESRGMVEITVEGRVAARIRREHFLKCPVQIGDDIDVDGYLDRVAAIQFADAYEAALTCLDFSARSAREIELALRRRGYVPPVIEAVKNRLVENRLLDDRRYAGRLAESQAQKPVGVYAVRRKLMAKGISGEDADAALAAFDGDQQREAAELAARKLFHKYASLPRREARAKLSQALARRGFAWDTIESVVEAMLP